MPLLLTLFNFRGGFSAHIRTSSFYCSINVHNMTIGVTYTVIMDSNPKNTKCINSILYTGLQQTSFHKNTSLINQVHKVQQHKKKTTPQVNPGFHILLWENRKYSSSLEAFYTGFGASNSRPSWHHFDFCIKMMPSENNDRWYRGLLSTGVETTKPLC